MKKAKKAAKKTVAKKGAAKKSKPVNLTAPDSEVTGQGLEPGRPMCNHSCSCLCGVRG
jgi:hypothetical protein